MKKVLGVFTVIVGLVGGLILGTALNSSAVLNVQKNNAKGSMIAVLDKDGNSLTGLTGVVKDRI